MAEEFSSLPTVIEEEEATPLPSERKAGFNLSRWYAALLPLAFLLGLGAGYLFWGRAAVASAENTAGKSAEASQEASQEAGQEAGQAQQITRYDVPVDDDPALGPANAPITLIEFSDYECPYCRRWHTEVFPRLLEEYPDQIRMVYRDFPLTSIHPNAEPAAVAANCANEQGAFWDFNQKLFSLELGLSAEAYRQYASDLGLDLASFEQCLENDRHLEEVRADLEFAANLGVRSTPTFFINGIAIVGAQPYELFKEVIDKELAGEIPK